MFQKWSGDFPDSRSNVLRLLCFQCGGVGVGGGQIQSLVEELGPHVPRGTAEK